LVWVNGEICLVIGEVLNFWQGASKINLTGVEAEDLDADGPKMTTVAVQILQLLPQEQNSKSVQEELTWMWPQKYIKIQNSKDGVFQQCHFVYSNPRKTLSSCGTQYKIQSTEEASLVTQQF
jgi:hypothetical protein